jgi:hypothetical protein
MSSLEPECQLENDTTLFDEQRMEEFFARQMGGFEKKKVFRDDFPGRVGNWGTAQNDLGGGVLKAGSVDISILDSTL